VKGNEPRLAELAGADGEHAVGEVGVAPFEVAGLESRRPVDARSEKNAT